MSRRRRIRLVEASVVSRHVLGLGCVTVNGQRFDSLLEAKVLLEDWRIDYNINRPHSADGWLTRSRRRYQCPISILRCTQTCLETSSVKASLFRRLSRSIRREKSGNGIYGMA